MEKKHRVALYQDRYVEDYGFEAVMVAARQRLVMDVLRKANPKIVLEVGCGMDMLAARANLAGIPVEQWIIVEPGKRFADAAQALRMANTRLDVVRGFLEDSVDVIKDRCASPPDFIICSGMLNEVADPLAILRAAKSLLGRSGMVHVNVPHALSLHRRLARTMGIIKTEQQLTERNNKLLQYRVFDFETLVDVAHSAGFRIAEKGGYFVKPFTHDQMQSIPDVLSEEVLDGLWKLGREMPELASEIYVNLEVA